VKILLPKLKDTLANDTSIPTHKLLEAVIAGNVDEVKKFISSSSLSGEEIDKIKTSNGYTSLHLAVQYNYWVIVELLIEKGCSESEQTFQHNWTPYMIGEIKGHTLFSIFGEFSSIGNDIFMALNGVFDISDQISHNFSTCTAESFNNERTLMTPKNKEYWKHFAGRAQTASLVRNEDGRGTVITKVAQKLGLNLSNATKEGLQQLDNRRRNEAQRFKTQKFKRNHKITKSNKKLQEREYFSQTRLKKQAELRGLPITVGKRLFKKPELLKSISDSDASETDQRLNQDLMPKSTSLTSVFDEPSKIIETMQHLKNKKDIEGEMKKHGLKPSSKLTVAEMKFQLCDKLSS